MLECEIYKRESKSEHMRKQERMRRNLLYRTWKERDVV